MTKTATPSPTATPASDRLLDAGSVGDQIHAYWKLTVEWVQSSVLELSIAVAIAVAVYVILTWLKRKAARIALQQEEQRNALTSIIARTFARTSKFFRAMVAAELVNGYANTPGVLSNTIHMLFTVAMVFQVAIWAREIVLGAIERRASEGDHEHDTLTNAMTLIRLLVSFAVFAIAVIVVLDNLGVNVTGLIAGLGVGGIAIGLAAQGIFSDLFAAISIIFDKPFRRGDTVTYGTTTAKVEKVGMKSTRLRALTGEQKIISNSKLLDLEITNATTVNFRRTTYTLGLVYQTTPAKLRALPEILQKAVEDNHADFVRCVFTTFNASSIDFALVFDIRAPEIDQLLQARHEVGMAVFEALVDNGYDLAYPTQTSFTAAPDGELIMPYPAEKPASKATAKTPAKRTRKA